MTPRPGERPLVSRLLPRAGEALRGGPDRAFWINVPAWTPEQERERGNRAPGAEGASPHSASIKKTLGAGDGHWGRGRFSVSLSYSSNIGLGGLWCKVG